MLPSAWPPPISPSFVSPCARNRLIFGFQFPGDALNAPMGVVVRRCFELFTQALTEFRYQVGVEVGEGFWILRKQLLKPL
jgi:hypothetical protein